MGRTTLKEILVNLELPLNLLSQVSWRVEHVIAKWEMLR